MAWAIPGSFSFVSNLLLQIRKLTVCFIDNLRGPRITCVKIDDRSVHCCGPLRIGFRELLCGLQSLSQVGQLHLALFSNLGLQSLLPPLR
jgi:hypothetical protein